MPQLSVNINNLPIIKCQCGCDVFLPAFKVRYASPLVTGQSSHTMVQVPAGYICTSCGLLNSLEAPIPTFGEADGANTH